MPDDRNDNNSQTPRDPKIPGMPGGKKPTRTGWLYFILACALLGYAFFNMGSGFASSSNTVKLATSEMVNAIKQDRVDDLTYTVVDGSVVVTIRCISSVFSYTSTGNSHISTIINSPSAGNFLTVFRKSNISRYIQATAFHISNRATKTFFSIIFPVYKIDFTSFQNLIVIK